MPRHYRLKGEYNTYHITQRGNEKKNIFLCDKDRARYLHTLCCMKEKYNFILEAYCLMNNHVHLLVYDNGRDISQIIKSINISYVYYFNHTHERVGHLFQDRFGSEIIRDDKYLLSASAYIHNNPVKAGLVNKPEEYAWSSFKAFIGIEKNEHQFIHPDRLLEMISCNKENAARAYYEYVLMKQSQKQIEFMDFDNDKHILSKENNNFINTTVNAENYIKEKLFKSGMTKGALCANKSFRNEIIKYLRSNSSMNLREIGKIVGGLSESTISKIVKS